MVTDQRGEVDQYSAEGLFADDTRFVSDYHLFIDGQPWQLLTSAAIHHDAAQFQLVNPQVITQQGEVPAQDVGLRVLRRVAGGVHEDLDLTNFAAQPVRFQLEIVVRSDFADIFEVREHRFVRRGRIGTTWDPARGELSNSYVNGDFSRRLVFRVSDADSRPEFSNGRIVFDVALERGASWHCCADYVLVEGERVREPTETCRGRRLVLEGAELGRRQGEWLSQATRLTSQSEDVYRTYLRSLKDVGSLRMHDEDLPESPHVPAAGVPWYVALFGRDALIVSLQSMLVYPDLARDVLDALAQHQAASMDDWRDAEPGKMPHELRVGELAHLGRIPHTPYYGSADSTPLYLILLHEAWKWLGDTGLLYRYRDVAVRCLDRIDHHGDLDGDGLQEYRTRSSRGYANMGWKDSYDAVVDADGKIVPAPKALCELQGYVLDARLRMAEIFDVLGEPERAQHLRQEAGALRRRFEKTFWCEDLDFYAFSLDPAKRPVKTVASNAGHCLWSGIVRPDRAERVVRRLMQPDMWTGWGIRTLSSLNPAYNPFSYHRGSVWPHDNALIALGFKRYGFADEASRIARDIFEAASSFNRYRLPELYAGLSRNFSPFPVQHLGANIPQAWAAGSVFHLLQAILGLRADAPAGCLYVHPTLPNWLPDLHGLRVGQTRLALRFWREGERSRWEVLGQRGGPEIDVREEPWRPWRISRRAVDNTAAYASDHSR
jgi:glycogen debranching enzyme